MFINLYIHDNDLFTSSINNKGTKSDARTIWGLKEARQIPLHSNLDLESGWQTSVCPLCDKHQEHTVPENQKYATYCLIHESKVQMLGVKSKL